MKVINVTELRAHLSLDLRPAAQGTRIVEKDCNEPIAELGPLQGDARSWRERLSQAVAALSRGLTVRGLDDGRREDSRSQAPGPGGA